MAVIPPWLDVKPSDFVQAAAAGSRIGSEIASRRTQSALASDRIQSGLAESQMRANAEAGGRSAEIGLAAARLQQEGREKDAERLLRQFEIQQQIKRQQDTIAAQNERAANALAERQQYGNSVLDIRREANRIAKERADNAATKPAPSDFMNVSEHTKEVPPAKTYHVTEPEIFNLFSKNTPGRTFDTTNVVDLAGLPRAANITTNTIPGTGSPARTITRRVPVADSPYGIPIPDDQGNPPPAANGGIKLRNKKTGEIGTVVNGAFVPDPQPGDAAPDDGDAASM